MIVFVSRGGKCDQGLSVYMSRGLCRKHHGVAISMTVAANNGDY